MPVRTAVLSLLCTFGCTAPPPSGDSTADNAGGGDSTDSGTEADSGGDSGGAGQAVDLDGATCVPTDNALRFACSVPSAPDAALTWVFTAPDSATRTFTLPASAHGAVVAWGLEPSTAYTWTVTANPSADGATVTGDIATGPLPDDFNDVEFDVSGRLEDVDAVLFPLPFKDAWWFVMVNSVGHVVWYELVQSGNADDPYAVTGFTWTADQTLLYSLNSVTMRELDTAGDIVMEATDFDRTIHHDLYRAGGYTYALNHAVHDGYSVDGFYVMSGSEVVASWDLADYVTPASLGLPTDIVDWSHANSIWSDGHVAYVSLRWLSAVVKVQADPTASDFGTIDSILEGSDDELDGDYTWPDGGDFYQQHHVTPTATGFSVFDNGEMSDNNSRALLITVDEADHTVREAESWGFGKYCDIEGAAYPVGTDKMLATCGTAGEVREFRSGSEQPIWTLHPRAAIGAGQNLVIPRGTPIRW